MRQAGRWRWKQVSYAPLPMRKKKKKFGREARKGAGKHRMGWEASKAF